jgi:molybdate transport system regulatory protein
MRLAFKLWLTDEEGKAFGPGPAQLLSQVEETGSLRQAAAQLGMSYNKAWWNIKTMERRLGYSLLERTVGGNSGGGSRLTEPGRELLNRYRALEAEAAEMLRELAQKHFQGQVTGPLAPKPPGRRS